MLVGKLTCVSSRSEAEGRPVLASTWGAAEEYAKQDFYFTQECIGAIFSAQKQSIKNGFKITLLTICYNNSLSWGFPANSLYWNHY